MGIRLHHQGLDEGDGLGDGVRLGVGDGVGLAVGINVGLGLGDDSKVWMQSTALQALILPWIQ